MLLGLGCVGCAGTPIYGKWTRRPDTGSFRTRRDPFREVGVLFLFGPEGPPIWMTEVWMSVSAWFESGAARATVQ